MAKRNEGKPSTSNRSLILASAESLGRMIGALQRQLGVAAGASSNGNRISKTNNKNKTNNKKKRSAPKPRLTPAPKSKGRG